MIDLDQIQRGILIEGVEDIVGLWQVARHVREAMGEVGGDVVRAESIRRLAPLLRNGLIEAGSSPYVNGTFDVWALAAEEAISRIDQEWRKLGRDPNIPDICWFKNTDRGTAIAHQLIAK